MLYQSAKNELQSPPHGLPLAALAIEAAAVLLLGWILAWWI